MRIALLILLAVVAWQQRLLEQERASLRMFVGRCASDPWLGKFYDPHKIRRLENARRMDYYDELERLQ